MILLVGAALSAEPEATTTSVDEAGNVEVRCFVPQSEAQVRAALADPLKAAMLPPEVLSVKQVGGMNASSCVTLGVTVKGAWDPLSYTAMRCPTAKGFKYHLLQSESITSYEAEWAVAPHAGGGTDVTYRVRTNVDLPVPQALIRKGVLQSAKDTVLRLVTRITGAR